ncbi:YceH family protein [Roseibacillus ishigakijimensis]|uniref:YceH family protein n=1 Tax=Roseibacillus ishigakijimensis TaxID=454146 RepID=A0A934RP88_9BACT|nr:YceH family protein [Roseibacillus ishigakijimensis]MBK1833307.1 YceH family protein [Roseibacillus ishigakijimensis]
MKHFPELQLTAVTARILGCLLEKEVTTPDLYPLTLNSLVTACNQSSSRHPVSNYSADEVSEGLRQLSEDYLVTKVLGGRAPKYEHNLPDVLDLSDGERAVLTVLLLRGTQTTGELKQRSERMHNFSSLDEVEEILSGFIDYPHGPLVERIPSGAGRRVETFRHLLAEDSLPDSSFPSNDRESQDWRQEMEQRIEALEKKVAELITARS